MYRFFVKENQIQGQEIQIMGNDVNHLKNVLRMKLGEEILISDGEKREYTCLIHAIDSEQVTAHIISVQESQAELPSKIYLFQGLPKSDKMELIIQKAVELGVYEIIPVMTKYTVVKLDAKKEESKRKRWQAIAESAAKQSKRNYIPKVTQTMKFIQALDYAKEVDIKFIPYEKAKCMQETKKLLVQIQPGQSIGVFIGPEGGFAEEEVELAIHHDIAPITLGKRILRTETAGLTILSILMFTLEE